MKVTQLTGGVKEECKTQWGTCRLGRGIEREEGWRREGGVGGEGIYTDIGKEYISAWFVSTKVFVMSGGGGGGYLER